MPEHYHSRPEDATKARVTSVLAVRAKPELEEYKENTPRAIREAKLLEANTRGTAVHEAIEAYLGGKPTPILPPEQDALYQGFINWHAKYQPTNILSEVYLVSTAYGYKGTTDLICEIDGEVWIIDFKTSKKLWPDTGLQLSAYREAYKEGTGTLWEVDKVRTGALHLHTNNKRGYTFKEFNEPIGVFLGLLVVYNWMTRNDLHAKPKPKLEFVKTIPM